MLENFGNIMETIKRLQQKADEVQQALKNKQIEVKHNDTLSVVVNGQQEVLSIVINPHYLTADHAALLQGLLVSTINSALAKSREINQAEMANLAGDLNLPKIPGLF